MAFNEKDAISSWETDLNSTRNPVDIDDDLVEDFSNTALSDPDTHDVIDEDFSSEHNNDTFNSNDNHSTTNSNDDGLEHVPPSPPLKPTVEWAHSATRYEWNDTFGDVAPRIPAMEDILFGKVGERGGTGLEFGSLLKMDVLVDNEGEVPFVESFADAGLHPVMLLNVELAGYERPTPVQQYCIPAILQGHDVLACAQTGSGKTAAFLIPILSKLMGKAKKLAAPRPKGHCPGFRSEPLVLILAPTRELATQIFDESRRFCYRTMFRPCVIYGGADFATQRYELEKGCDLLVATPGRLMDFLERGRSLSLRRVRYTVVDEADEMLDMGFAPQLRGFFMHGDMNRDDDLQITMFSATYPPEIQHLAREFLSDSHIRIAVGRIGSTHRNITQNVIYVEESEKCETLSTLLLNSPPTRTLIFANQKSTVDTLDDYLYNMSFPCTSIHSSRSQREREDALRAFRTGRCPILVATSVASRGLDIKNVMHVINYDVARDVNEYVHRIGRTARIGNRGLATTFYNENNSAIAKDLVMLLMESEQQIPDFLEHYKAEIEAEQTGGGGAGAGGIAEAATTASSSWGTEDSTAGTGEGWNGGDDDGDGRAGGSGSGGGDTNGNGNGKANGGWQEEQAVNGGGDGGWEAGSSW